MNAGLIDRRPSLGATISPVADRPQRSPEEVRLGVLYVYSDVWVHDDQTRWMLKHLASGAEHHGVAAGPDEAYFAIAAKVQEWFPEMRVATEYRVIREHWDSPAQAPKQP